MTQNTPYDFSLVPKTCLMLNFREVCRELTQIYEEQLKTIGLYSTQYTLLVSLILQEPQQISSLAKTIGLDRTTLTRNLSLLVKKGWVTYEKSSDSRKKIVKITRDGQNILDLAFPIWQKVQNMFIEDLGKKNFNEILSNLKQMQHINNTKLTPKEN